MIKKKDLTGSNNVKNSSYKDLETSKKGVNQI